MTKPKIEPISEKDFTEMVNKGEPVYTAEQFGSAYQELSKKMGFGLSITPTWMPRDDGTYSMKLDVKIIKNGKD
jgi:hypothetical protein